MKSNFPPETAHESTLASLLNILGCVIENQSAVYVSAPITSGRRLAAWLSERDLEIDLSHAETYEEFRREVLEPNSEHARNIIQRLRSHSLRQLVDPTALKDIKGWVQDDYRVLWGRVIQQYAETVIFLDGWQFSNGCAYEFLVANRMVPRPTIFKETLEDLTFGEGIQLIEAAVIELRQSKFTTDFLQHVLNQLTKLHITQEALTGA